MSQRQRLVRRIFDLYANQKMGIRRISQKLYDEGFTSRRGNAFNVLTIRHILENPKYKGWYCANKSQTVDYRSKRKIFLEEDEWIMYPDPLHPCDCIGRIVGPGQRSLQAAPPANAVSPECCQSFVIDIRIAEKSYVRNMAPAFIGKYGKA